MLQESKRSQSKISFKVAELRNTIVHSAKVDFVYHQGVAPKAASIGKKISAIKRHQQQEIKLYQLTCKGYENTARFVPKHRIS